MTVAPLAATVNEVDVAAALEALKPLPPTPPEVEGAYVTLHRAIRDAYVAAFGSLQHGQRGYVPTFSHNNQPRSRVLSGAPLVLNQAVELEKAAAALAADFAGAPSLAASLAGRWPPRAVGLFFLGTAADQARNFLRDAAGPFAKSFAAFQRTATAGLDGARRGKVVLPPEVRDSPLVWLQVGLCQLLLVPFALQAAYAALSAKALYDVDGNTGARAAATKLGAALRNAQGGDAEDSDLLRMRATVGSLEDYVAGLWRSLGIDFRSPREPLVRPYAELAARLVDAELRGGGPHKLKADALEAWGVPLHLGARPSGGRVTFSPTWPPIVGRGEYGVGENAVIMHDHPGAQLGLFVASLLYERAKRYVVPADQDPAAFLPPVVTAGCLQFGGAHPPHKTHRSGAEVDADLVDLRNLERPLFRQGIPKKIMEARFKVDPVNPDAEFWVDFKNSPFHRHWRDQLTAAIQADRVDPRAEPFRSFKRPPWDHYGTNDPENIDVVGNLSPPDTPTQVAQARAFCLSLLLSGTSRLLFADPWVFIDSFHRLRSARTDFETELRSAGVRLPRPFGWPVRETVVLEPIAHFNHFHGEWKHAKHTFNGVGRAPAKKIARRPGPDPAAWVPVWKALDLDLRLEQLTGFLSEISGGMLPAIRQAADELAAAITRHWGEPPNDYPDLYRIVFDGSKEGDRELLRDTAHTGAQDGE